MSLPDLSKMRGMGEPLFFSFNTVNGGRLLCHAVIFSSFEIDESVTIKLCEMSDDPRMPHFFHFVVENYGKVAKENLQKEVIRMADEINQLETKIKYLKRELRK